MSSSHLYESLRCACNVSVMHISNVNYWLISGSVRRLVPGSALLFCYNLSKPHVTKSGGARDYSQ